MHIMGGAPSLGSNRGVGRHSSYQYCVLLSIEAVRDIVDSVPCTTVNHTHLHKPKHSIAINGFVPIFRQKLSVLNIS